ncbi:hypothetical protein LV779_07300 [Streptomyces thinghirensis]|nr:hypothetical protein [Streptomyces thinghirensis]
MDDRERWTPTTRALAWSSHRWWPACSSCRRYGRWRRPAARACRDRRGRAVVGVVYAGRPRSSPSAPPPCRRAVAGRAVGAVWLALLALSAEGVWLAFPLYFVQLHLLSRDVPD